jgi:hypothetical protein
LTETTTAAPSAPAAPAAPAASPVDIAIAEALGTEIPAAAPVETPPAQEAKTEAPPATEVPPASPVSEVKEPQVAKGLAAIASREAQMQRAHQARMAELRAEEARIKAERESGSLLDKKAFRTLLLEDPAQALRMLEIEEKRGSDVARGLYVSSLGPDAPKELREQQQFTQLQRQIAELHRKYDEAQQSLVRQQQESAQRAALDNYKAKLASDIPKLSENLKFVRAYAAARPELVVEQLTQMAIRYAEAHPYASEAPTAQQLAEMLEPELSSQLDPIVQHLIPKFPAPIAEKKQPAATQTLTNTALAAPSRPAAVPQSDDELIDQIAGELRVL